MNKPNTLVITNQARENLNDKKIDKWTTIPDLAIINKTIAALKANGIEAEYVATAAEAKQKILASVPEGGQVMTMTSTTMNQLGVYEVINDSGKYDAVRKQLSDPNVPKLEKQRLGAAPEYSMGSVHAITEDGHLFIASNTGSQMAAHVYGATHVVLAAGAHKIVSNDDEARSRITEHTLPLESERARKAYGVAGSFISKMLIINKEVQPDRIKLFIIGEVLGF